MHPHDEDRRRPIPVATRYRDGTPAEDGYGNAPDAREIDRAIHSGGSSESSRLPKLPNPLQLADDWIAGRRSS